MTDTALDGEVSDTPVGDAVVADPAAKPPEPVVSDPSGETGVIGAATDPASNESQKPEEFEEYELSLADDSPLSQEDLDAVAAEASRLGLGKEDAEKLLSIKEGSYKSGMSAAELKASNENAANRQALLEMPEFQGEAAKETFATIKTVTDTFGDQEFIDLLKGPAGNNKALAKFLINIGNSMKSDTLAGKGVPAGAPQEKSLLETMYPTFYEDKK